METEDRNHPTTKCRAGKVSSIELKLALQLRVRERPSLKACTHQGGSVTHVFVKLILSGLACVEFKPRKPSAATERGRMLEIHASPLKIGFTIVASVLSIYVGTPVPIHEPRSP